MRGKGRDKWKGIERSRESFYFCQSFYISLLTSYRDNRDGETKRDRETKQKRKEREREREVKGI